MLIENALESCILAYVPNQMDLYEDFDMMFSRKIKLAHMLGIIDAEERRVLERFNKTRNSIAHAKSGTKPAQRITQKDEESLWNSFIAKLPAQAIWPKYDGSKFPAFLRYLIVYLYTTLHSRAEALKDKRLTAVFDVVGGAEEDRYVDRPFLAMLIVNWLTWIGDIETAVFKAQFIRQNTRLRKKFRRKLLGLASAKRSRRRAFRPNRAKAKS